MLMRNLRQKFPSWANPLHFASCSKSTEKWFSSQCKQCGVTRSMASHMRNPHKALSVLQTLEQLATLINHASTCLPTRHPRAYVAHGGLICRRPVSRAEIRVKGVTGTGSECREEVRTTVLCFCDCVFVRPIHTTWDVALGLRLLQSLNDGARLAQTPKQPQGDRVGRASCAVTRAWRTSGSFFFDFGMNFCIFTLSEGKKMLWYRK